jgi:hypothetical protein
LLEHHHFTSSSTRFDVRNFFLLDADLKNFADVDINADADTENFIDTSLEAINRSD